jgi:hypothetical protein
MLFLLFYSLVIKNIRLPAPSKEVQKVNLICELPLQLAISKFTPGTLMNICITRLAPCHQINHKYLRCALLSAYSLWNTGDLSPNIK